MWNITNMPTACKSTFYCSIKMTLMVVPYPALPFLPLWSVLGILVISTEDKPRGKGQSQSSSFNNLLTVPVMPHLWSSLGLFDVVLCLVYLPAPLYGGCPIQHLTGPLSLSFSTLRQRASLSDLSKPMTQFQVSENSKSPYFHKLLSFKSWSSRQLKDVCYAFQTPPI